MMMTIDQHQYDIGQSRISRLHLPSHLSRGAVVAVDEASLSVPPEEVRQYLRERMSPEALEAEIDVISEVARQREEFGDFSFLGLKPMQQGYACVDCGHSLLTWMHEHERARLNQLKIALPTPAEQAFAARARIQERIARRKLAKQSPA
ncbi:hypothetical protein [Stutzerimonas stutzeri]|uniref:hypothetical protein n=1 Tax=Stutzerimonas stutzeri TaxID=316 RepID=UPI001BCC7F6B|nr:hypothetical protein [Stutzerimonas stutzeri]